MWWTNHTSQIWREKKKDSWDPPQSFWFKPGSEAGTLYFAFLISKWGFYFENYGSVSEICGKTLYIDKAKSVMQNSTDLGLFCFPTMTVWITIPSWSLYEK